MPRAEETADAGANDQGELAQPLEEVRRYVPTPPPSPGEMAAGTAAEEVKEGKAGSATVT